MSEDSRASAQALRDAFELFNQLSDELNVSYRELEGQVERLNEELAAARSERLQQLAEKERLADRLSRLLEGLPGGVVVLDGDGVVQEYNPAAAGMLGEPLHNQAWESIARRAFEPDTARGSEVSLRGGTRVSIASQPLTIEAGRILLLQDVTETCRLQELVNRQKRLSAMGEMMAGLAHQVRTPLASALLSVGQLEQDHVDEAKRHRCAERIRARLQHLEHTVNDMLLFARGGYPDSAERVDLNVLVNECKRTLEPQLEMAGVELILQPSPASAETTGNRQALQGIITNLVTNAADAGGEAVRIGIAVRHSSQGWIEVSVSDNGPGIPAEHKEQIFEPFFTTRASGTGLGLAVVRAVAEAHYGTVTLNSVLGEGSVFRLYLPSADAEEALISGALEHPIHSTAQSA